MPWLWYWDYVAPEVPIVIPPSPPPVVHPEGYIDRLKQGMARVIMQYTESPKFLAWLAVLLALEQDTEDTLQAMKMQTAIDTAEGVNLWTIATIVGAPIVYTNNLASDFIAWSDQTAGFGFHDANDETLPGGRWREEGEVEVTVADLWAAQRLVIRCAIIRNHSTGTGDSIQRALMYLFPNVACMVYDLKDMSFYIGIGRYLTTVETQLIWEYDLLPRPAGVRLAWDLSVAFDDPYFGFEDQVGGFTDAAGNVLGGAETFDIGKWANLEYWITDATQTSLPLLRSRPPVKPLDLILIPTRR